MSGIPPSGPGPDQPDVRGAARGKQAAPTSFENHESSRQSRRRGAPRKGGEVNPDLAKTRKKLEDRNQGRDHTDKYISGLEERFQAVVLLGAVGDAVGSRGGDWKNSNSAKIMKEFGKLTRGTMNALDLELKYWRVGDDTVEHLATCEGICDGLMMLGNETAKGDEEVSTKIHQVSWKTFTKGKSYWSHRTIRADLVRFHRELFDFELCWRCSPILVISPRKRY